VIPKLNEADTLPYVFARVPRGVHEVIVVEGNSTDDTVTAARRLRPDARVLRLPSVRPHGWQFAVKHGIDRMVAAVTLLLLTPLLLVIAIAIRLSSPGPALFRQYRVGRDGRRFLLLKFRTMCDEPNAGTEFVPPDGVAPGGVEGPDRRTRLGCLLRASALDELPQLINVLRGEMSLVGPRPERPEYVARFARDIAGYDNRHCVKPGITGWAQVNGLRGQTSITDRVEFDNYYIRTWSLWFDLWILALTVAEVFRFRDYGLSPSS
jgi:lipopolysaccharide/colanic/teichoic acid biosynthesis glycosyltransferase